MSHAFALRRDVAGEQEHEAAERVDLVLVGRQPRVDRCGELLELDPGIGFPQAVVEHGQHARLGLVMLVLDVADDLLDDVLDRDQALGAAEFVDDDREVDALAAHPRQQLDHAHRFGHEQRLAHQRGERPVARSVDVGDEHVLDVDHADDVIEALAIDRQAAVAGVGEGLDQLVEADVRRARR